MTTPFKLLTQLAGLSLPEAGRFLDVRPDTVKSWASGRNPTPDGAIDQLRDLIDRIDIAAEQALQVIDETQPADIELGYCADDHEAQSLGFPCVGAHNAVLARVVCDAEVPVRLVPRGSTTTTAAAIDAGINRQS